MRSNSSLRKLKLMNKNDVTQEVRVVTHVDDKWLQILDSVIDKIQDISESLDKHYGKIVLFALLSSFVCITAQVYYLINICRKFSSFKNPEISMSVSCILVTLHIVEMGVMFPLGSKIKREVCIINI